MAINLTPAVVKVLHAFLADAENVFYGAGLTASTGVSSGSLYPALTRLEREGWITGMGEDVDPREVGRPARRLYRMTGRGVCEAHVALVELSESVRPPAASPGWLEERERSSH
ncbi:PadR family transcriptional regulator [Streptomyces sp. BV286]|uniref:PadR family transcriptional regulator n=1 Tax=Streptomyces sp. BV286 TaxID=2849672 RepID=UPI001C2E731E|nr:helix-turn-helix transcriptional regulator [Streptomyces sp. BV286]MBV1940831.1 PadR family transcriptional regulator [Streptomyces sp. BV286]